MSVSKKGSLRAMVRLSPCGQKVTGSSLGISHWQSQVRLPTIHPLRCGPSPDPAWTRDACAPGYFMSVSNMCPIRIHEAGWRVFDTDSWREVTCWWFGVTPKYLTGESSNSKHVAFKIFSFAESELETPARKACEFVSINSQTGDVMIKGTQTTLIVGEWALRNSIKLSAKHGLISLSSLHEGWNLNVLLERIAACW